MTTATGIRLWARKSWTPSGGLWQQHHRQGVHLTADDNIAIGTNSVITGNTAADSIITAGG
ncbi:MAG: hypothetical protein ACLT8E_01940 [Akkermansia sp.]